jgi:hypothetical protein
MHVLELYNGMIIWTEFKRYKKFKSKLELIKMMHKGFYIICIFS